MFKIQNLKIKVLGKCRLMRIVYLPCQNLNHKGKSLNPYLDREKSLIKVFNAYLLAYGLYKAATPNFLLYLFKTKIKKI